MDLIVEIEVIEQWSGGQASPIRVSRAFILLLVITVHTVHHVFYAPLERHPAP